MPFAEGDHPAVKEMHEHWYKILAILMHKFGMRDLEVTQDDIEALGDDAGIIADTRDGRLFVRLRTMDEITEIQRKEREERQQLEDG